MSDLKLKSAMTGNFSLFLDFMRGSAALLVVAAHLANPRLQGGWINWAYELGNEAVMLFFVLSGLIISYVSQQRENTLQRFSVARLARLWSVVLLALVFTFFADSLGRSLEPSLYSKDWYYENMPALRLLASAFFVNEIWFKQILPLSNGPFWSLSYEFWYYVIFAVLCFSRGWKRVLLLGVVMLIVGPKILLLWPVFLMGQAVWFIIQRQLIARATALLLGVVAICLFVWAKFYDLEYFTYYLISLPLLSEWQPILEWRRSAFFVSDWIYGALISMIFLGAHALVSGLPKPNHIFAIAVRYVASATLFIYLFHYPLIHLLHAVGVSIGLEADGSLQAYIATSAIVLLLVFGPWLERTKAFWYVYLNHIYDFLSKCLDSWRRRWP
ncbi:MAG: acyltransferase family protein [Mariprofundaceae bacterium]